MSLSLEADPPLIGSNDNRVPRGLGSYYGWGAHRGDLLNGGGETDALNIASGNAGDGGDFTAAGSKADRRRLLVWKRLRRRLVQLKLAVGDVFAEAVRLL